MDESYLHQVSSAKAAAFNPLTAMLMSSAHELHEHGVQS